ncbi:MAG: FAD-binding oxidoreductase [Patescibacteria group bacterium]|nr:FAD-binding oxidoreductase [Patescibacteria group bacterium]
MITEELKAGFRGDIATDDATLESHSRDYSIFKVRPLMVVFPRDVDDVKRLVRFVEEKRKKKEYFTLTARAAGTDMTGGPLSESIVVNFTRYMNRIKEIGKDYVVVEPGVYFRDLEPELAKKGLMYPAYPASKDFCAIGGIVMNNSGGEKTLLYGKTERYVDGLKMVLADGEEHAIVPVSRGSLIARSKKRDFESQTWRKLKQIVEKNAEEISRAQPDVSKNSSGYSLWNVWNGTTLDPIRLFVGSQGTLGLMTEVKLHLVPMPKYSRLVVIFLRTLSPVADLVNELLEFKPESIESYDDKTFGIALRFLPSLFRSMKGSFLKLLWEFLPEVGMMIRSGGMPKMVMLVSFTAESEADLQDTITAVTGRIRKKFKVSVRAVRDAQEEEKYWTIRRQSFALLHGHIKNRDTAPFIDDIVVRPRYLPDFLPKLNAILDKYKQHLIYTIAGHPGDGNFHIIPLMDLKNPEVRSLIPIISEEVYELVLQYHGSITAEHNDGIIRTPYIARMYGEDMARIFMEVKTLFDPHGIFNPGKKVGGTIKYAMDHIKSNRE